MKVAAGFGDPQSTCKLEVDALLVRSPWENNVDTGTALPSAGDQPGRDRPLVIVRLEAWEGVTWPVRGDVRLRVVTWSDDADQAWDVSSYVHGHLLASTGAPGHRGYRYSSGPGRDRDPDFAVPISAFTITMKARPVILGGDPAATPTA